VVQDDGGNISEEHTITLTQEELRTLVESAVVQKIRPLQREIADLKETTRLHDILGGIGYIMGIGGVVFYFLGVRRKKSHK
jgi:nickel transport protein